MAAAKIDSAVDVEVPEAHVIRKRKVLTIVGICIAVAVLLIIIVVLVVVLTAKNDEPPKKGLKYVLCQDENCKTLVQEITKSMDKYVDPCENFYSYACGGWQKNNPLNGKASSTVMGIMSDENINHVKKGLEQASVKYPQNEAVKKTVDFYNTCLYTIGITMQGLAPMKNLILQYGGWSVSDNYDSGVTIATRIGKAARDLNVQSLFGVKAEADVFDSKSVILTLLPAGLSKSLFGQKGSDLDFWKERAYKKYMKAAGKLFAGSNTDAKMMEIFDFEKKLYELKGNPAYEGDHVTAPRNKRMRRNSFQDDRMTITQFCTDSEFECSLLKEILQIIYGQSFTGDVKLSNPDTMYFKGLYQLYKSHIDNNKTHIVADYIMWRVVDHYMSALDESHSKLKDEFTETPVSPRWKTCIDAMMKGFQLTLGLLYIDQANFDDKSKKAVEDMTNDVRTAFIERLPSQTWMDAETQNKAKEKALAITLDIGYPTLIKDPEKLKKEYSTLIIGDHNFANYVAMNHYIRMKEIGIYGKPVNKTVWEGGNPSEVNGIYDSFRNSIVYLAGIIQPPLYNKDYPSYINYGAIGAVIGHELTHGFDGEGRKYDKDGQFVNWWSQSAAKNFEEKTSCLVNQYGKYSMFDTNINGKLTLDENIADNGGIKISYDAYERWVAQNGTVKLLPDLDLDPDQLFFLGYAQIWCSAHTEEDAKHQIATDSHTIGKYRVIGALANFEKFSEAFKCPSESTMNPSKKCAVW